MNSITIDLISADWKVAASARYYAERGNGEEFAFGMTPSEALARLEEREASANRKFQQDRAEEIAFLALGAANHLRQHPEANLSKFGGVWLYDVTERFGREWAEELLSGTTESPSDRLEYIIADEMEKWA